MNIYNSNFEVRATVEKVIEFHQDGRVLRKLIPFPIIVQFHMIQPMREGSIIDFTLWLGPVPVRWVAVHHDIQPMTGFTDSMMRGPFEAWEHTHRFEAIDANHTRILDTVEALPGPHPFWGRISKVLWGSLPLLFTYRRWKIRRALEH